MSEILYEIPPNQNMESGLYSSYIHPLNNQYVQMKAKGGALADFDLDGDFDYIVGNIGLNTKYMASKDKSEILLSLIHI